MKKLKVFESTSTDEQENKLGQMLKDIGQSIKSNNVDFQAVVEYREKTLIVMVDGNTIVKVKVWYFIPDDNTLKGNIQFFGDAKKNGMDNTELYDPKGMDFDKAKGIIKDSVIKAIEATKIN